MADSGGEQPLRDFMPVKANLPRAVDGVAYLLPAAQIPAVKNGDAGKKREGGIDQIEIGARAAYRGVGVKAAQDGVAERFHDDSELTTVGSIVTLLNK